MSNRSFASLRLNDQLFGVDILSIREINRHQEMTQVPHAPEYIYGLMNLRGQIVTVMDLKARLGIGQCTQTSNTHIVILKTESELSGLQNSLDGEPIIASSDKVGLLVDEIGDVITVPAIEIDAPPANIGNLDGKYLSGVIKLENTLLGVLSVSQILNHNRN